MSVPEPEKGDEEGQGEDGPEPVLLIRLDEADALVHLRSMVSYIFSTSFPSFLPPFSLSLSILGHGLRGNDSLTSRNLI